MSAILPGPDPLALPIGRGGVPRDRHDRALLKPRGIDARVPYTAASTLSSYIANHRGIHIWEKRLLARGLGLREDLAALAAVEEYTTGFSMPDIGPNKASGRRLDEIVQRALDAARVHERADYGTAFHRATEKPPNPHPIMAPKRMRNDIESFWHAVRGFRFVATEIFIANDTYMSAGTPDHLVWHPRWPDTLIVLDKKTGQLQLKEAAVQLAVYGGGELYDPETDQRTSFVEQYGLPVNQEVAFWCWTPAGSGRTELIPIDLVEGHAAARAAVWVRDWQRDAAVRPQSVDPDDLAREMAHHLVATAPVETLGSIWREFQDVWTDELTELAKRRLVR